MATITNNADNEVVRLTRTPDGLLRINIETNTSAATARLGRTAAVELLQALSDLLISGITDESPAATASDGPGR